MKKIAVIPIDNRPICHSLIKQICAIDEDIKLFIPERTLLGGLYSKSNINEILNWLNELEYVDYLILSLDTVAYGGLINSRRGCESYDEILTRILKLQKAIKNKAGKIYAFSSIMRISNNNINEEEKTYWMQFGKRIFDYSYNLHKSRKQKSFNCVTNTVPKEILEDYLNTRKRNFEINKYYLKLSGDGVFDTLIFSKDDTGEFGLNVEEAEIIAAEIQENNYPANVKTGADEIPLTLLCKAFTDGKKISVNPIFIQPKGAEKISKYEDISVINCVKSQLNLAGLEIEENNPDLNFIINNFENIQGDLVLGEANPSNTPVFNKNIPYFIADINNANGADSNFVEIFIQNKIDENFYGYSAYNTSANSIGSAIAIALAKFCAQKYNETAFKKLTLIRFLDDWAYQANIRKNVRNFGQTNNKFEIEPFALEFKPFENKICKFLGLNCGKIDYKLPWKRSFEVEVEVEVEVDLGK